jgi:hypothetical protein
MSLVRHVKVEVRKQKGRAKKDEFNQGITLNRIDHERALKFSARFTRALQAP